MFKGKLIASGSNAKTVKGDGEAYETAIMYLAPFTVAGVGNVCAMAERAKCWEGCLNTAGRGVFNSVQKARVNKTTRYMRERVGFMSDLVKDLIRFSNYCEKKGVRPAVRLNGTSDIMWEKGHPVEVKGVRYSSVMEAFPEIQFYDYSKIYTRVDRLLPRNYSITLSFSAANSDYATEIMSRLWAGKANVAVVYRTKDRVQGLVKGYYALKVDGRTFPVIDGDETDMRFLDPQGGYVVALYAKGKAKKDHSGFVVD